MAARSFAVVLALAPTAAAAAQQPGADLAVTPRWATDAFVGARTTLELELSRPLDGPRERLAVVIGTLDVSALVLVRGDRARYRPVAARLPSGANEVITYLVTREGEWREVGRAPLRVRSATGFESGAVVPSIDLSSTGQLDQSVAQGELPPERRTYQDLTLRLGLQGLAVRDGWQLSGQANAIGVTEEHQRLRFADLAGDAPAVDLSDYQLQVERGRARLTAGSVTAGKNRYLLNGFGSRGVSATLGLGPVATVDASFVNGTSVVGWSNFLGLSRSAHRIGAATVGLELLPSRPGAIHIDFSGVDASVLPVTSFNQGAATDAEESRGFGVQLALSDSRQRVRFAGGISRSRFDNPTDPLLTGDTSVVAVQTTTRRARYGELGLQLLQALPISPSVQASFGVAARHERIDPLYRSVGAAVQSDVESNGLDATGALGALSFQASLSNSRDNLAEIPSILTSRTRSRGLSAALPAGSLFRAGAGAWYWPALSWSWQSTRQFGEGVPANGDFSSSHVPDQRSTNHSASLAWARGTWSLTYRWNRSFQDNRQIDREQADFRAIVHGLSLALTPSARFMASTDLSVERQKSFETGVTQRLERLGGSAQWQVTRTTSVSGTLSQSWGFDPLAAQRTRNTEYQGELSQGFNLYRRLDSGTQGRLFVRYARTRAAFYPFQPVALLSPRTVWTLSAGGSLRVY
jgi:hypothetical protein